MTKKFPLVNGWEIGWSRETLVAALDRGDNATNAAFNVDFAYDAAEAAHFLQEDIDNIENNWEGSGEDLEFIRNFIKRFHR